ncbi:MAG: hypothetical protein V7746_06825 [Halioglobus sp.]
MNKLLTGLFSSILLVGSAATMAQVIVTPDDGQGWFADEQAGSATGSISVAQPRGAGTGSLEFITTGNIADQLSAVKVPTPLVKLSKISGVGYDFYASDPVRGPAIKLWYLGGNVFPFSGVLIYEPGENGAYPVGAWVSRQNVVAGNWWLSSEPAGPRKTLTQWGMDLGDPTVSFLRAGVGSGWNVATTSYVDLVTLNGTTWDFEATPTAGPLPPEPAPTPTAPEVVSTMSAYGLVVTMLGLFFVAARRIRASAKRD